MGLEVHGLSRASSTVPERKEAFRSHGCQHRRSARSFRLVTGKGAVVDIPFGGGKGWHQSADRSKMSRSELERLTRRYTASFRTAGGPSARVPAPTLHRRANHGLGDGTYSGTRARATTRWFTGNAHRNWAVRVRDARSSPAVELMICVGQGPGQTGDEKRDTRVFVYPGFGKTWDRWPRI